MKPQGEELAAALCGPYLPAHGALLLALLDQPDQGLRLQALRALGRSGDRQAAALVLLRVRKLGFGRRSQGEKRAHFMVAVFAGGDACLDGLKLLLEHRGWLRRLDVDTRLCALHALGALASERAATMLAAEATRFPDNPVLVGACERLAKEVRRRLEKASAAEVEDVQRAALEESTTYNAVQVAAALRAFNVELKTMREPVDLSESFKKRILVNFERIPSMTHYDILGVKRDAGEDTIRAASQRVLARYSPDRNHGKNLGSYGPRMDAIRAAVERARDVLLNPHLRKRYDAEQGR